MCARRSGGQSNPAFRLCETARLRCFVFQFSSFRDKRADFTINAQTLSQNRVPRLLLVTLEYASAVQSGLSGRSIVVPAGISR